MSDANKNLVRRHFEKIWNQRRMAACDELMADDFSEHAAAPFATTAPGRVHGPTAMRGTAEWLLDQFPDLSMRIESIVGGPAWAPVSGRGKRGRRAPAGCRRRMVAGSA